MLENYFKLFKLPQQCEVNVNELKARFRELQQVVHPDQHATGTNKEQLIAGQMSAYTNDAYQTLKNPLSRYKYLLSLNGFEFTEHTHQDTGFLMLQMQLREDLADISEEKEPEQAIENFQENLSKMTSNQTGAFKCAFLAEDYKLAYQEVVKLQFFDKLLQDVERLEDQLL